MGELLPIFFLAIFIVIIALTLLGNILVLVLSVLARKLPTPLNCCYVSMAIADLLVAAFAMTSKVADFALHSISAIGEDHHLEDHSVETVTEWSSKNIVCDTHHFLRIFACTASIMHVCIVAIERCRSLDKPFGFMVSDSYKATVIELLVAWTVSLFSSVVSAFWMYQHDVVLSNATTTVAMIMTSNATRVIRSAEQLETVVEGDCVYPSSVVYLVGSSLICYYIPLSIMFCFYWKIYILAKKQLDNLKAGASHQTSKSPSGNWRHFSFRMHRGGNHTVDKNKTRDNKNTVLSSGPNSPLSGTPVRPKTLGFDNNNNNPGNAKSPLAVTPCEESSGTTTRRSRERSSFFKQAALKRATIKEAKKNKYPTIEKLVTTFTPISRTDLLKKWQYYVNETKALRTLGMLLGVFVACWSPYFVLNLVFAGFGRANVPNDGILFDAFIWLGFLNSAFNPMLYPLSANEYRQGMRALLRSIFQGTTNPTARRLCNHINKTANIYQRRENLRHTIMSIQKNAESVDCETPKFCLASPDTGLFGKPSDDDVFVIMEEKENSDAKDNDCANSMPESKSLQTFTSLPDFHFKMLSKSQRHSMVNVKYIGKRTVTEVDGSSEKPQASLVSEKLNMLYQSNHEANSQPRLRQRTMSVYNKNLNKGGRIFVKNSRSSSKIFYRKESDYSKPESSVSSMEAPYISQLVLEKSSGSLGCDTIGSETERAENTDCLSEHESVKSNESNATRGDKKALSKARIRLNRSFRQLRNSFKLKTPKPPNEHSLSMFLFSTAGLNPDSFVTTTEELAVSTHTLKPEPPIERPGLVSRSKSNDIRGAIRTSQDEGNKASRSSLRYTSSPSNNQLHWYRSFQSGSHKSERRLKHPMDSSVSSLSSTVSQNSDFS